MDRRWVGLGSVEVAGLAMFLGVGAAYMVHVDGGHVHVDFDESSLARRRIMVVGVRSGEWVGRLEASRRRSFFCMLAGFGESMAAGFVGFCVLRVPCERRGLGGCSSLLEYEVNEGLTLH